jgi:hypothetical protein
MLELWQAMEPHWGPVKGMGSKPTSFLDPMLEEVDGDDARRASTVGLPMPEELGKHLMGIWALREPGDPKVHKAFKVTKGAWDTYCRFAATPSRQDLEALGISKDNFQREIRPKVTKQEVVALASRAGDASADSIRLAGISAAGMEAQGHLLQQVGEDFSLVQGDAELAKNMVNQLMSQLCEADISSDDMYEHLTTIKEVLVRSASQQESMSELLRVVDVARTLGVSTAFAMVDLHARRVVDLVRPIREASSNVLLTDTAGKVLSPLQAPFIAQGYQPSELFLKGFAKGLQLVASEQETKDKTALYLESIGIRPSSCIQPRPKQPFHGPRGHGFAARSRGVGFWGANFGQQGTFRGTQGRDTFSGPTGGSARGGN